MEDKIKGLKSEIRRLQIEHDKYHDCLIGSRCQNDKLKEAMNDLVERVNNSDMVIPRSYGKSIFIEWGKKYGHLLK